MACPCAPATVIGAVAVRGCGFCWGHGAICCRRLARACRGLLRRRARFAARFGLWFRLPARLRRLFSPLSLVRGLVLLQARSPAKLRGFRRRLVAFHAYSGGIPVRCTPGNAPGKCISLRSPGKLLLLVETKHVELVRIEIRAGRQAQAHTLRRALQA